MPSQIWVARAHDLCPFYGEVLLPARSGLDVALFAGLLVPLVELRP
jgi:hypothetical protein